MINTGVLKKILYKIFLIQVLYLAFVPVVLSQGYTLVNFTTSHGLTHNNVRQMITDSSGFLWISTWDGLNRYDGYEFKQYHHQPGDTTSFPFFSLNDIRVDGSDNLWILADNGQVARLNRERDNFTVLNRIEGSAVPKVLNVLTDQKGDVWIITFRSMIRYIHNEKRFKTYRIRFQEESDSLVAGTPYTLTAEREGRIWLTSSMAYKMELDHDNNVAFVLERYFVDSEALSPKRVIRGTDHQYWFDLKISDSGKPWIISNEGLFTLDEEGKVFRKFRGGFPADEFRSLDFLVWGSISGGIYIFRGATGRIMAIPPDISGYLKAYHVNGSDMLWYSFTTLTGNPGGLGKMIFTPEFFKKYNPSTPEDRLPAVYSLTTDRDKNLWLGIRGRDHITIFKPDGRIEKKHVPMEREPSYYGPPRSMIRTENGIWTGYFYGLLLFYDYNSGRFKKHETGLEYFRAMAVANDTSIITGQYNLNRYNPLSGVNKIITDSLSGSGIFRLTQDITGIIWGAMSECRFFRYDQNTGKLKLFRYTGGVYNIEDVLPVDPSEVWLALLGGGVVKYNPETGESKTYTTSSGLSNNTTYSLLRDKNGNIWVSTDNGISRLNPSTGIIKNFGTSEGLDIVEFNSGASLADSDGRYYFGGMGGAVSFYPDSINRFENRGSKQRILLSAFTASGRFKILDRPLNKTDTVTLAPGENNFRLTFSSTDYSNSPKTLYRYKMEGQEKVWVIAGPANRTINYTNLKPGYHSLIIEATDRNGEWAASRRMTIDVRPLFYQSHIFKISVVITLFTVFYLLISLYIRQIQQKNRQVQDGLRLQALRGQMNPHFIFNSLNSINYFISRNDKISANRYISDFSRLIRSILSNMGSDYVPFETEISSIRDYLGIEHLRFGDKFDYEITTEVNGSLERVEIFPGLIQPFIENAIWHGIRALENRKGTIRVSIITKENERIQCIVEDDGVGRKASSVIRKENPGHKSKGISIVAERLSIISKLNGREYKLELSDLYPEKEETGTVVKIDIPFRTA